MNDKDRSVRRPLDAENRECLVALVRGYRWGALATLSDAGEPMASSVAISLSHGRDGFLLHLSRLAEHTRNLLTRPVAGLLIGESDHGEGDPQILRRLSVQCSVLVLSPAHADYANARRTYTEKFPHAEPRFDFSDFELFYLRPLRAQYIGGFARAFALDADTLAEILADCVLK